jgi:hypothetical protein
MNKTILALLIAASASGQAQAPAPYISTFGAWALCASGAAAVLNIDCSWYTPGNETYSLNIPESKGGSAIGYSYAITATLMDGSTKSLAGVTLKNAVDGYTIVPHLVFGGVVKSTTIEVEELFPGAKVRAEGAPVSRLMRRRSTP